MPNSYAGVLFRVHMLLLHSHRLAGRAGATETLTYSFLCCREPASLESLGGPTVSRAFPNTYMKERLHTETFRVSITCLRKADQHGGSGKAMVSVHSWTHARPARARLWTAGCVQDREPSIPQEGSSCTVSRWPLQTSPGSWILIQQLKGNCPLWCWWLRSSKPNLDSFPAVICDPGLILFSYLYLFPLPCFFLVSSSSSGIVCVL